MHDHPGRRARRRWRPTPDTAIALLALTLAVGGGGYALGAATGDQVITACLNSDPAASGQPAKIITSGSCEGGQTPLSWNQAGPQGSQGAQGLQGPVGPAGVATADPTVVALPPKPSLRRKGTFLVELQLPGPGTYQIDGHVQWTRSAIPADAPLECRIIRDQPVTVLDFQKATVLKADIFNVGAIDASALTTVAPPASSGPVQALAVPVKVTFRCTAKRSATSSGVNPRILFRDWTLSATPVKVSAVQKQG